MNTLSRVLRCFAAVLALASMACTAPPTLPLRPPAKAAASDAALMHETGSFEAHDGLLLFEQSWHPPGPTRAVLVAHHGLKDQSDRYAPFAERLVRAGFAVYAYDMRGHGRSAGPRATFDSIDDLLDDLSIFMDRVRTREGGARVFLLGHSVGGLTVTLFTLERRPVLAGLIVLAPAIRVEAMPFQAAATPVAAILAPNLPVVDVPDAFFLRSPADRDEMGKSEFVYHPSGPARSAASIIDGIRRVWARADELSAPLLGLHGTEDKATDPRGTVELVRRARSADKKLLLYRGVVHDLLHEPEHEQIEADIEKWIVAHSPGAPP
jgi:alpha-beta hydrolase superfamily lysophospholipase